MFRKSILSMLVGVMFAVVLSVTTVANASCFGFCAERISNYYWVGCDIVSTSTEIHVTCYYIEGPPPGGDPYIAE
ncbi:MAG TPA: hypothetical protein VJ306_18660 [Pyrinomonadaceae bacterium]|jgi:hypothetical protein|nr:hypothetical protein [Pyrinomonadaceae bacterium]